MVKCMSALFLSGQTEKLFPVKKKNRIKQSCLISQNIRANLTLHSLIYPLSNVKIREKKSEKSK